MVDVKKIYEASSFDWWDYDPMIEAFGNVAVRVDDRGYQGDTRVLYNNAGRIGHLIFGWGSCSGCDALQSCNTLKEVQELCNDLENDIEWFERRDWEGDYSWYCSETREYVDKAIKYLRNLEGKE